MDLKKISRKYDNDPLYDAYTGDYLYDGQFATYDGSQLDGSFIRRRTVSMSPDFAMPPRRVVRLFDENWILSDPIVDGFKGRRIRQTMSARKVHGLYDILSAAELTLGTVTPRQAYSFKRWTKATGDAGTSDLEPYFEFSFSLTEASVRGKFIVSGDSIWHVRMDTEVAEGFLLAEADEILSAESGERVTVDKPGAMDPVTLQESAGTSYPGVLVERYNFYRRLDQAQALNYPGDKTLVMAKSSDPDPTGFVRIAGHQWNILAMQDLGDGFGLHVRRTT